MPHVAVVLGSKSDMDKVRDSKMLDKLSSFNLTYEVSVLSAHRNPAELAEYCEKTDAKVFITVAGLSAALPGVVAAHSLFRGHHQLVIGVGLSGKILDGLDAMFSIVRMPPGVGVAFAGLDSEGLQNAALLAAQAVNGKDGIEVDLARFAELLNESKPPQVAFEAG